MHRKGVAAMVEMYNIHHRIGRAMPTGSYEITRTKTRREITKFSEVYRTDIGDLSPEQWWTELLKAIEIDKEADVLEVIVDHCKRNCAWLHKEDDILNYAMEILAGRTFLCGNECWKDVADKVKDRYFIFTFRETGGESGNA